MTNISTNTAYITLAIASYANNMTKEGAWCVYGKAYADGKKPIDTLVISNRAIGATTDNQMMLTGTIEALKATIDHQKPVYLLVNSKYVLDGIQKHGAKWERNGWRGADKKTVANKDQWAELLVLCKSPLVTISECGGGRHNKLYEQAKAKAKDLIVPALVNRTGFAGGSNF
jgi:ribonuclease HI